jgi:serine/threonine protein kinase
MVERGGAGADRPDITLPGFVLRRVIGRGGFATVYEAYQPALDRPVAMKVLSRLDGRALELFQRECRAAGHLGWHDHIVDVFDTGWVPDGRPTW